MTAAKRLFDVTFSLFALVLLLPALPFVAVFIKLDSSGPVFFRQIRVGRFGKLFFIYKFRTMQFDAESAGRQITVSNDGRITRCGKFLRKYKIDEVPQLFNVLKGDMSVVGPRPEVPHYVELYTPQQKKVIELQPGITDPASILYSRESELLETSDDPEKTYLESIMPEKLRINLEYASRASFLMDLKVILKTVVQIFR